MKRYNRHTVPDRKLRWRRRGRHAVKSAGETIREMGILLLVFGLLDEHTRRAQKLLDVELRQVCADVPYDMGWVQFALIGGVLLILGGIVLDSLVS